MAKLLLSCFWSRKEYIMSVGITFVGGANCYLRGQPDLVIPVHGALFELIIASCNSRPNRRQNEKRRQTNEKPQLRTGLLCCSERESLNTTSATFRDSGGNLSFYKHKLPPSVRTANRHRLFHDRSVHGNCRHICTTNTLSQRLYLNWLVSRAHDTIHFCSNIYMNRSIFCYWSFSKYKWMSWIWRNVSATSNTIQKYRNNIIVWIIKYILCYIKFGSSNNCLWNTVICSYIFKINT